MEPAGLELYRSIVDDLSLMKRRASRSDRRFVTHANRRFYTSLISPGLLIFLERFSSKVPKDTSVDRIWKICNLRESKILNVLSIFPFSPKGSIRRFRLGFFLHLHLDIFTLIRLRLYFSFGLYFFHSYFVMQRNISNLRKMYMTRGTVQILK